MFRTQITKRFFSMFVVGFIGFIIFSGFLISSQISSFMSNASQQLDHKAENVASRIEGRLQQSHGCVGMLALNPLVQEGDSEVLTNLLTKVFEQSPSYEALLVIDSNGTLIAEAPKGSYYKYNSGNNKLTPKPTEHRLLHITAQDGSEYYALTNTVLVKGADSAGESRSMISFVNLNSIVETTFMGSCEDEISIVKKNGEEIALYVPDYDARLDSAPVMIKFLNFIAGQKGLPLYRGPQWCRNLSGLSLCLSPMNCSGSTM